MAAAARAFRRDQQAADAIGGEYLGAGAEAARSDR